mmetsp:Transcript_15661/g.45227  ORF Transcript_15661/g.45227 Transcript_15661/m.45227 type:complete len:110 (+) Transcript_15661:487-816(+)
MHHFRYEKNQKECSANEENKAGPDNESGDRVIRNHDNKREADGDGLQDSHHEDSDVFRLRTYFASSSTMARGGITTLLSRLRRSRACSPSAVVSLLVLLQQCIYLYCYF